MKASSIFLLLVASHASLAYGDTFEPWSMPKFNAFISQGYTQTTDNNMYGTSQDSYGSFSLRELGISASANITGSVFSSVQILSRKTGQYDDDDVNLDYALIDYSHSPSEVNSYGLRIGRIKNPLGFYNETRDVAFTRPSVILPQSIYFDRTRDLALSADGIHFYSNAQALNHSTEIIIGVGKPRVDKKSASRILLGQTADGSLKSDISYIWKFEFNTSPYTLSYSGAALKLTYDTPPNAATGDGEVNFLINVLSFQYDSEHFSITSEYADRRFKFDNLTTLVPRQKLNGESYYVQVTTRASLKLEYFLRYDVLYQNRDDRNGQEFARLTGGSRPSHSQFAKDWTIGLRWDINRHWMLSFEHHWINGTAWLPIQNNPTPLDTRKKWRLLAGVISYKF